MNPLITTLLPTAVNLLQELGKTDLGQKALNEGQKVIEVAIPLVKKASQLTINFLSADILSNQINKTKTIELSKPLDIVDNALSLPVSYQQNQFQTINQKISGELDLLRGQNEILFLSHSINYFLESHKSRTGIDRGISYALQYDIVAVCNYLQKRKDLRFPGYLLHQFTSLGETIKEVNIFYHSILHDGHVLEYDKEEIKEELSKQFGIDKRKAEIGMYIPSHLKMEILREFSLNTPTDKINIIDSFLGKMIPKSGELNEAAHDALFILKQELICNEELEYQIVKKLKVLPEQKIIIQTPSI